MLANGVFVALFHKSIGGMVQAFLAEALALELYHSPKWLLSLIRANAPYMGTAHLVAEAPLKAAAERRAAKLRAQMTS